MTDNDQITYGYDALQAGLADQTLLGLESLSYEEYFKKIDEICDLLKAHWLQSQRVKALKVTIQLTKLLAEASQLKLYPKKYKLITDALDEFGRLIYLRVHSIASGDTKQAQNYDSKRLSVATARPSNSDESGTASRELARDVCRNWFLKVASIRELVPRFYCELSLLKACDILLTSRYTTSLQIPFYTQTLRRLTKTAWGFGDPIVALHARLYLCKVAERLIGWDDESKEEILFDLIASNLKNCMTVVCSLDITTLVNAVRLDHSDLTLYYDLILNTVQSVLNILKTRYEIYHDDKVFVARFEERFQEILKNVFLEQVNKHNIITKCVSLDTITKALPEEVIAQHAYCLLDIIKDIHSEFHTRYGIGEDLRSFIPILYSLLKNFMIAFDSSESFEKRLNPELARHIMKHAHIMQTELLSAEYSNPTNLSPYYLKSFQSLLSYTNHYFNQKDVDILIDEFIGRIQLERRYAYHSQTISNIIKTLFSNKSSLKDYEQLINSNQFIRLVDLLRKDNYRLEISQWILETMRSTIKMGDQQRTSITDKKTINFIMKRCAAINDTLSFLTTDDDCTHLSELVIYFLDIIIISDHRERLEFFSRMRGFCGNLNLVVHYLSRQVLDLAIQNRKTERNRNQRKNFLNGCLAYVFVSIPAVEDETSRLELAIDGCRLALEHTSLSIADYYFRQILAYLEEQLVKEVSAQTIKIPSYSNISEQSTNGQKQSQISKQLSNLIQTFLSLTQEYQEHIDLEHKLTLSNLIRKFLNDQWLFMRSLGFLNCVDDDDNDNEVN